MRTENWTTEIVFAGIETCVHKMIQGKNETVSESVTSMHFICSACLREETKTRTFVENHIDEYDTLKSLEKSKGFPHGKTITATATGTNEQLESINS